ncbi:MAG: prepilin-type N-terminal cleavage/methylation domain-containing protein [Pirellulales bacterium]|nr:prepilin-type N-terminal cleavage/methylation domain-containing protein [Pirellulales bacterium]
MKRSSKSAGFTLVELLVVIVVIGILAATAMFVLFKAESYGKEGKTRTRVAALHRMVFDQWENYATRRLNVDADPPSTFDDRKQAALDVLLAMDFPFRWDEITGVADADRSAMSRAYKARYDAISPNTNLQAAECLYLIVTMNARGREYFNDSDIGDTDGDGALEFLDAWGRPIFFLRAPSGFPSTLVADQANNPMPLIDSAGPDKRFGLNVDPGAGDIGTPLDGTDYYLDNIHNHQLFE